MVSNTVTYELFRTPGFYRQPSSYRLRGRAGRMAGRNRLSIQRIVRSMAEHKKFDNSWSFGPGTGNGYVNDSGEFFDLSNVTQGASFSQRIGDKITATSLQINITSNQMPSGVVVGYDPLDYYYLRIIIFIWKDDTVPVIGDILDGFIGQLPTQTYNEPIEWLNHDKKVKRKILMDKTYRQYGNQGASALAFTSQNPVLNPKIFIPLNRLTRSRLNIMNFQNETNTAVNKIYLLAKSNVKTAVGGELNSWMFKLNSRLNFIDM